MQESVTDTFRAAQPLIDIAFKDAARGRCELQAGVANAGAVL